MWSSTEVEKSRKEAKRQECRRWIGPSLFYLLFVFFSWNLNIEYLNTFSPASKLYDKLGNSLETLKSLLMIGHTWWVTIIQASSERDPETSVEFPSARHKELHGNLATKYSWIHSVVLEVNWAQHTQVSPQVIKAQWHTHRDTWNKGSCKPGWKQWTTRMWDW